MSVYTRHTFRVVAVLFHIPIDFDKLLQNRSVTACAFVRESGAVMKVAIDGIFMLVVRVRWTKESLETRFYRMKIGEVR